MLNNVLSGLTVGMKRAIVLTFLVLVGHIAISQTVVDATYLDTDDDGNIDQVLVEFSEAVNDGTVDELDFVFEGASPSGVVAGTANDEFITFTVSVTGTAANNTASYTAGSLQNLSATPFASNLDITRVDAAEPILLSLSAVSSSLIQMQYSEDLSGFTYTDGITIADVGVSISGVALNGTDDSIVEISVTGITTTDFTSTLDLTVDAGDVFEDATGNSAANLTTEAITDGQSPVISATGALDANNEFIEITFSEGIYAAGGGIPEPSDFQIDLTGGTANLSISSVRTTGNAALTGGETIIRFNLVQDGASDGNEDFTISPVTSAIEDLAGNEMSDTEATTLRTLNALDVVLVTNVTVAADNSFVDVTFSEPIERQTGGGVVRYDPTQEFYIINFNDPDGTVTLNAVTVDITNNSGGTLLTSDNIVRFDLTGDITGTPTGNETFDIFNRENDRVVGGTTGGLLPLETTIPVTLNDARPTVVDATYLDSNDDGNIDQVLVEFSEAVDDDTVDELDFTFEGANPSSFTTVTVDDEFITFNVTITGTATTSAASYTAGGLQTPGAAPFASNSDITRIDGAEPILLSLSAESGTLIQMQYSEDLSGFTYTDGISIADAGVSISGVALNGTDDSIVEISVTGISGTAFTSTLDLTVDAGDVFQDAAGNSVADLTTEAIADGQAPTLTSLRAVSGTLIQMQYSEDLSGFTYTDGISIADAGVSISGVALNGTDDSIVEISVTGITTTDFTSTLDLTVDAGDVFQDAAGNSVADLTTEAIADGQVPTILTGGTLDGDNNFVDITFSEGIVDDLGTAVEASDFTLTFTPNATAGTITDVLITSVTTTGGAALSGGESTIRFNLSQNGSSTNVEEISISPVTSAVEDGAGNVMSDSEASDDFVLNTVDVVTVTNVTVAADNAHVDVTFSDQIQRSPAVTRVRYNLGEEFYVINYNDPDGLVSFDETLISITDTDGNQVETTDNIIRFDLSSAITAGTPDGNETFDIFNVASSRVVGTVSGDFLPAETTIAVTLNNAFPTVVDATYLDSNDDGDIDQVLVEFSEAVDDDTVDELDFVFEGSNPASFTTGSIDDEFITFNVSITGTATSGTASYTAGGLQNLSAVAFDSNLDITRIDGAEPVLLSLSAVSGTLIQMQYSEDLSGFTYTDGISIADAGVSISGVALNSGDASIVEISVTGITTTDFTSTLNLTVDAGDIFQDAAGNSVANLTTEAIADGQAPTLTSVTAVSNTLIQLQYSEDLNNGTFAYTSGITVSSNTVSGVALNGSDNSILEVTVTGLGNTAFAGTIDLTEGVSNTIEDAAGNAVGDLSGQAVADGQVPTILAGGTLEGSNTYLDVTFSEGIVNDLGSAVEASDFVLTFTPNGTSGSITGVTITSLTTTGGAALSGGESTIRFNLSQNGSSTNVEEISISPVTSAVEDGSGNVMADSQTTDDFVLNTVSIVAVSNVTVAADNAFVDVTFSDQIQRSPAGTRVRYNPGEEFYIINYNDPDGVVTFDETSVTITDTDGNQVETTDNIIRFDLSSAITGTPDGNETFDIFNAATSRVIGTVSGDFLPAETTIAVTLSDARPTVVDATYLDSNDDGDIDQVLVEFSAAVDDDSVDENDFIFEGNNPSGFTTGSIDDEFITFNVAITGTATSSTASYTAGSLQSLSALAIQSNADITRIDGAEPILLSLSATSSTLIEMQYSEDLSGFTYTDGISIADAGVSISGVALNSGDDSIVEISVTGITTTDFTTTLDLTVDAGDVFQDAAGNSVADLATEPVTDGQSPTVVDAVTLDLDNDGFVDALEIEFSEAVDDATFIAGTIDDWEISSDAFGTEIDNLSGFSSTTTVVSGGTDSGVSDEFVRLTFTANLTIGTGVFNYRYTSGGTDITDAAGNALGTVSSTAAQDEASPSFIFTSPADESTNVSVAAVGNELVFEVSESATLNPGVFLNLAKNAILEETIDLNGSSVDISGTTVTVTLTDLLAKDAGYAVNIDAGAFTDGAGNTAILNNSWNWTMEASGDPTIVGNFPADMATDVPLNTEIQLFFDQDVRYQDNAASETSADTRFTIIAAADANFGAGGRDYTIDGGATDAGFAPAFVDAGTDLQDTITFDLANASTNGSFTGLQAGVTYTVEVGAKSFEFSSSGSDTPGTGVTYSFQFTTVADGTSPVLSSQVPADQPAFTPIVDAATTTQLDLIFDEDVQEGSGNIQLFLDSDDDGIADATLFDIPSNDAAISYIAEVATTDKVRIDLSALGVTLSSGVSYFVNVDDGAILDEAGNAYGGIADATTWNFTTTADAAAPTVVSLSPDDNSTNVAIGADFVIEFDEAVTLGTTEEVTILLSSNNAVIESLPASSLSVNNNELTIDWASDLSGFSDYYIQVDAGVVSDFSGNPFAGFTSKITWNFKTESGSDMVAPAVVTIDPTDGETDIALLPTFTITFDEPVFGNTGNFYVNDGGIVETFDVASDVTIVGNEVSFTSTVTLANGTAHTVTWDAGVVTDTEGNNVGLVTAQTAITGDWNFTTIADNTAPTVVSLTPADDDTGVTADGTFALVLDFDEPIATGSGNIEIFYNDGITLAPSQTFAVTSAVLTNSDQTATFTVGPLDGNTEYYVSVPGTAFDDQAAAPNSLAAIDADGSWSFTTAADVSAPTATATSPTDGGTGADLDGGYTITFSERVIAGTGNITLTSASQTIAIDVADGTQVSGFGTTQLTINPLEDLYNSESYDVTFDAAAVTDASGNAFSPAAGFWDFTTENGVVVTDAAASFCEDGPFVTLSDLEIDETNVDDFVVGTNQTIIIDLPTDFEFNAGVGSISGASGDITATSVNVTASTLTITYSIGTVAATDQLVVSGLQVQYTGNSAIAGQGVTRSGSGTADQEGNQSFQGQAHLTLTSNLAPDAPDIEDATDPGVFITELAVESVGGSTFTLDVNSPTGGSTYEWENIESLNAFIGASATETDLTNDADYNILTNNLYSFDVTETDANGCVSPVTRFNILNYDITLNPNVTAFSEDDTDGTDITLSKPANHTATLTGTGLGSIVIPASGTSGDATATFVPNTAGSGGSPYQITYGITNDNTGESFNLTEGLEFTVASSVTIFANSVPLDYCFTSDDINSDVDLDVSITPAMFSFYRVGLFDASGTEITGGLEPANATTWATSGVTGGFVTGDFTSTDWVLDPTAVSASGTYEIRYFIVLTGSLEANLSTNEQEFTSQDIDIFALPDVEVTNFGTGDAFYCEDEGLVEITATLNGSAVVVDGFSLLGIDGPADTESATITGDQFDPADPLEDGVSYATSEYTLTYVSDAADDANGCVNTAFKTISNLAKPDVPALTLGTVTGTDEVLYEFCEGDNIPNFEIATPSSDAGVVYTWFDAALDDVATGTSASASNLFDTDAPTPGTYDFTVTRTDFTDNTAIDGCSSDVLELTVIIYEVPSVAEVDLTSSTNGFKVDNSTFTYNYCEGDVLEDITLLNTLAGGSADSTFLWFNEDMTLISSATFADALNQTATATELGLSSSGLAADFDTTFFVSKEEFETTGQFDGCVSEMITINITIYDTPAAPLTTDGTGDFLTEYYACEGDTEVTGNGSSSVSSLKAPDVSGETYNWYADADGTGSTPGTFIAQSNNIALTTLSAAAVPLDLDMSDVYYFWMTKTTQADAGVGFVGCESPATRVAITVYPNPVAPEADNEQGTNGAGNAAYAFCFGDIETTDVFQVTGTYTPFNSDPDLSRIFRWYESNASGDLIPSNEIIVSDADGSEATASDLDLVGQTARTRYFLITQVTEIRADGNFTGCEGPGTLIQVDILDIPNAPAVTGGTSFEYCDGDTFVDLAVTGEGNANEEFTWRDSGGTIVHTGATASATDLGVDTDIDNSIVSDVVITFTVTQTQDIDFDGYTFAGCESSEETVEIIIHPIPAEPVVAVAGSLGICSGDALPTLSVSNQLPGATLSWRNASNVEVSTASNYDPAISNINTGTTPVTTTFTVVQIQDGCESPAASVTITVNNFPGEPTTDGNGSTADSYVYCASSDVSSETLDITSPVTGSTYTWYATNTTSDPIRTGTSINFTDVDFALSALDIDNDGTASVFVRETTDAGCEGDAKEVVITILPLPVLTVDNLAAEYCFDDGTFTITGLNNGVALGDPTMASFSINTGGLVDNNDGTATITPEDAALAAGGTREGNVTNHIITFTYTDGNGCTISEDVPFDINPQPVITIDVASLVFCFDNGDVVLQGQADGVDVNTGTFTTSTTGGLGLTDNLNGTAIFNPEDAAVAEGETETGGTTTHMITFTHTDGNGCQNATTITLTVNPLPELGIVLSSDGVTTIDGLDVCYDDAAFNIQGIADGSAASTGSFVAENGGLTDNNDGTATFTPSVAAVGAGESREGFISTHDITYTFTDANGCVNSTTLTISVNPQPTLDIVDDGFGFSIEDASVCYNEDPFDIVGQASFVNVIADNITINTGGLTYDGVTGLATFDPAAAAAAAGGTATGAATSHQITMTYTDGLGCSNSITYTVTVEPQPEVSIRNTDSSPLSTVGYCVDDANQTFQAFADGLAVTTGVTFTLDGVTQASVNGQVTFSPSTLGAGSYDLEMTYETATDPFCENTVTETIVVNALPVLDVVLESSPTTSADGLDICYDDAAITLRGFADGSTQTTGSFATFSGLTDNGDGTATFDPELAALGAGETRTGETSTFNVTYTYTDATDGCVNSVTVTINVQPQPDLDIVNNDTGITMEDEQICFDAADIEITGQRVTSSGSSNIIADNITISTGGLTFDAVTGIATIDPEAAATAAGGTIEGDATRHTITLTYTDGFGCANSVAYNITIEPKPEVSIRNTDGTSLPTVGYCVDDADQTIQAFADGAAVTTGVAFTVDGVTQSVSGGQITFSPSGRGAGTYTVRMTYTSGTDPFCDNFVEQDIVVNPLPVVDVVLESSPTTSVDGLDFCYDDAAITLRGYADGATQTSGTFSTFSGLTDNGDGTATFDPELAALGVGETRTGETSTFNVTYTYTDATTGCINSITVTINVQPQPDLDIVNNDTGDTMEDEFICFDDAAIEIIGRRVTSSGSSDIIADNITISTGGLTFDAGTGIATLDPAVAADAVGGTREGDATTHDITLTYTDGFGCSNSITYTITIEPQPEVSIRNTDGTSLPSVGYCVDDADQTIQAFADGSAVTTGVIFTVDGVTQSVTSGQITFSPSGRGAGTYTVRMTYTSGSDPFCENFVEQDIVVNPLPVVDVVLESDPTTSADGLDICYDDTAITLRGFADGATQTSGTFTTFSGLTDNGDGTATFDPELAALGAGETRTGEASTFNITYTYTDATTGCVNSVIVTIDVQPQPDLDIVNNDTGDTMEDEFICFDDAAIEIIGRRVTSSGSSDIIADNITISTGGLTFDAGTGIATLDPAVAADAAGGTREGDATTHDITLTYTDGFGCSNSITYTITIEPQPEVSIRNTDGSSLPAVGYCVDDADQTIQAFADGSAVTTGVIFTVDGVTQSVTSGQITFSPSGRGAGTYTVRMTYTNGTDPFCENFVEQDIVVNPLPIVDVVLESDPTTSADGLDICYDDTAITLRGFADGATQSSGTFTTFSGLTDNGDGTATFDPELAALGAGETRTGEASTFNITYTYTDATTGCVNSVTVTIDVQPQPDLDIVNNDTGDTMQDEFICFDAAAIEIIGQRVTSSGTSDIIADDITISTGGLTFDAATGIATIDPEAAATAAGETIEGDASTHDITLTYTDGFGCSNSITYTITIEPKPEVSIRNTDGTSLSAIGYCVDDADQTFQAFADGVAVTTGVTFTVDGVTQSVTDGQVAFSPSGRGEGSYDLVMTYVSDTDPFCENTITETIVVNPLPRLDVVLESDPATSVDGLDICYDDDAIIIRGSADDVTQSIGSFIEFAGLTDNGDGTATFDPEVAALGVGQTREGSVSTHEITYNFQDPATNCENTVMVTVTVNPQPALIVADQSTSSSIEGTIICFDADDITIIGRRDLDGTVSDIIADNITINTGGLTFDAATGTATLDPEAAAIAAGQTSEGDESVHQITLTFSDALSCNNTTTVEFTISPLPALEIRYPDGSAIPGEFCVDAATQTFQAFADNAAVTNNVSVTLNNSPLTVTDGSFTFSPATLLEGSFDLVLTYISESGAFCSNTTMTTIVVNPLPDLDIIVSATGEQLGTVADEFCYDEESIALIGRDNGTAVDGEWRVEFESSAGTFTALPSSVIEEQADGSAIFNPRLAALNSGMERTGNETNMRVYFSHTDDNSCFIEEFASISINPQPELEIVNLSNVQIGGTSVCYDDATFTIKGRFDGTNDAASGTFTINPAAPTGFVDNGDGTASFNPMQIATDNGQARTGTNEDYIITFDYTDDNGCNNTVTRTITINAQPEVSFTGIVGNEVVFTTSVDGSGVYEISVVDSAFFIDNVNNAILLRATGVTGGTFLGQGVQTPAVGDAFFSPFFARQANIAAPPSSFVISYQVDVTENGATCSNMVTHNILVNPIPISTNVTDEGAADAITVEKACFGEETTLSVDISNMNESELAYQWYIGEDEIAGATNRTYVDNLVNEEAIEREYSVVVTNTVTNSSIVYERLITFGTIPDPKFKWDFVTADETADGIDGRATRVTITDDQLTLPENSAEFASIEFYIIDDANDTIYRAEAAAGLMLDEEINFLFTEPGLYTGSLVVNTQNGCSTTETRGINIVPYIVVDPLGYQESFEFDDHGWYTDSVDFANPFEDRQPATSWELGVPNNTRIAAAADQFQAWVTGLDSDYNNDELSYVYSPTYNIRDLEKPTISFERAHDFDNTSDGVILQYSTNGGQLWVTLGEATDDDNDNVLEQSGVEWYNSLSIRGFTKDDQLDNLFGWTTDGLPREETRDSIWVTSIHKLDLPDQDADSVRFRFALGTNAEDSAEGFAFDDFRLFSRNRLSIIETFSTILSDRSNEANEATRSILTDPAQLLTDVIWINYFNDFENDISGGRVDPLNQRNQLVPGTMSTLYGVNAAPRAVINGSLQAQTLNNPQNDFELLGWSTSVLSNSSLSQPEVIIELDSVATDRDRISLSVTLTANADFDENTELTTRIILLETEIDAASLNPELTTPLTDPVYNVVRDMLPSPDGFNFTGNVTAGSFMAEYSAEWEVSGVYHPDRLRAIVYVQDESDRRVLQAAIIDINPKINVVTGIEEQFLSGEDFALYPNPANNQVNIVFDRPLQKSANFRLIDQTGKILMDGGLSVGTREFPVETTELASGVYFISISDDAVTLKPRRLIVVHK